MRTNRLILFSTVVFTILSAPAFAEMTKTSARADIPTDEKEFVASINGFEKADILGQLGEPSAQDDIKTESGKIVASIWHYHNLNTDDQGSYYQTTELDFVGDKVVTVVFMNNDGSDIGAGAKPSPAEVKPEL